MTVQEALNNILRATFGRDVRQSIHDGIKAANDVCEETEQRQTEFENKMNKMVENGEFTGTIEIGNVVTGEPGTEASVTNRGTKQNAVLDMVIPEGKTGKVENIETVAVEFEEAGTRENINSGENFSGIFGKVKKWFADLGTAAFMKTANNLVTTGEGFLLDARQGKVLDEKISELTSKLEKTEYTLQTDFADNFTLTRFGKICNVQFDNLKNLTKGENEIGVLPDGFIPLQSINCTTKSPTSSIEVRVTMRIDGKITVYNYSETVIGSTNLSDCLSYPVA